MAPSPQHPGSGRVVFGPFEFVAESLDLRKHGTRIRLRGQPVQILEKLLSRPGVVVTREELQVLLWKDTTFVDFEQGLNAAVNKLRQALGDSADQPRYIETVPGMGYRFVAPVHFAVARPVVEMPLPEPQPRSGNMNGRRILLGLAGGVAMLAALGAGIPVWLMWHNRPAAPSAAVRFQIPVPPELRLSGSETFSLSPDGSNVVYLARTATGPLSLWVQPLNKLEPRRLQGTEMDSDPPAFWSPDSKELAFYSGERLKVVNVNGGQPRELCTAPSIVLGGAWSRDGVIVFGTETRGIMRVSARGGTAVPVTRRDSARGERVHAWPSMLPDGKHFIYLRLGSDPAMSGLFVRSVDARPEDPDVKKLLATSFRAVFTEVAGQGVVLFQREDALFAQQLDTASLTLQGEASMVVPKVGRTRAFGFFDASANGRLVHRDSPSETGRFFWFDRRGKKLGPVGEEHYLDASPVISPDGGQFAISRFDDRATDIWTHDLGRDVSQKITKDPGLDVAPVWSADGHNIYYSSSRSGTYDLYRVAAGGGPETVVLATKDNKFATSTAPDGKFLLFESRAGGGNADIWLLPLEGEKTPQPLVRTAANEASGKFSPDGKMLAWVSNESGVPEVYCARFPVAGGVDSKVVVSRGGGNLPRWGRGGKELYYRAPDGTLMVVSMRSVEGPKPGGAMALFRLPGIRWDVAPDGERVLVDEPVSKNVPPFVTVLDWAAEWRR